MKDSRLHKVAKSRKASDITQMIDVQTNLACWTDQALMVVCPTALEDGRYETKTYRRLNNHDPIYPNWVKFYFNFKPRFVVEAKELSRMFRQATVVECENAKAVKFAVVQGVLHVTIATPLGEYDGHTPVMCDDFAGTVNQTEPIIKWLGKSDGWVEVMFDRFIVLRDGNGEMLMVS